MQTSPESVSPSELINAVLEVLAHGETLLQETTDDTYTRKLPDAFNASIGGHYRHGLDHFRSLLEVVREGDLNYDLRERGTLVENDRYAALNATRELRAGFEQLDPACLSRTLQVTCKTSHNSTNSQVATSTVGREIMYVVAHAVHHYALIRLMGGLIGLKLPAGFGIAPSTLAHQARSAATSA